MSERYRFPCGCSWPVLGPPPAEGALPLLDYDPERDGVPLCQATWDLLSLGETKGVFQLESNLGRKWTKTLMPRSLEHIGALGAILRPGSLRAMDKDGRSMTEHYCLRKNGQEGVPGIHPAIDQILAQTYGVICFQEQCLEIAKAVAGFSLAEADSLRKAIGKKLTEEMAKCKLQFMEGVRREKIISEEIGEEVFAWIEKSQRYSFNKAHAISYGILGHETAYAKAHFPHAFYASSLAYAKASADPKAEVAELAADAKMRGVAVLPPDFRTLEADVQTDGVSVRMGLSSVRSVGPATLAEIARAVRSAEATLRKPASQFTWVDFLLHCLGVPSAAANSLVRAGAFDFTGLSRRRMEEELRLYGGLTGREAQWAARMDLLGRKLLAPEDLAGPSPAEPDPSSPRYAGLDEKEAKRKLSADRSSWRKKSARWSELIESLRRAEPFDSAEKAMAAVAGCAAAGRAAKVLGAVAMLQSPPSPLQDTPDRLAAMEEEALGAALTASKVDAYDKTGADCDCRGFVLGTAPKAVVAALVGSVNVRPAKTGKNQGREMASLSLSDKGGVIADAVCFPEEWAACRESLRPGSCVLAAGERGRGGSFVIKKAVLMRRIA